MHNFTDSQAFAKQYENAPWWYSIYKRAFPGLTTMSLVSDGEWGQFAGIDRVLVLDCGKVIKIDEKVRGENYADFALERWSDTERRKPGWIQKNLDTDYIAYAFPSSGRCYLLPFRDLQRAWKVHGRDWIERYQRVLGKNCGYTTECIAVPIDVVLYAITDGMFFAFDATAADGSEEEALRLARELCRPPEEEE